MEAYTHFREIQHDLKRGALTCGEVVQHHLSIIKNKTHLNAFLGVYEEEALARAAEIDKKIKAGNAGKLAGLVVGLKDVLAYQDHPLQGSSKILDGFISQFNATAVQRLLDADAIIIGRLNCDEFAMGSSNENSAFGPVLNDIDNTRVPGGSSGGSAVAVMAGMCQVALGSDTGGSVRQPASFCGVIGLKPTYSRISRFGLIATALRSIVSVFSQKAWKTLRWYWKSSPVRMTMTAPFRANPFPVTPMPSRNPFRKNTKSLTSGKQLNPPGSNRK